MWERITAIGTAILVILTIVLISQGPSIPWLHWPGFILPLVIVSSLVIAAILNFRTAQLHAKTANKEIQFKLAALMRQGLELYERLLGIQTSAQVSSVRNDYVGWANQTYAVLNEGGYPTDAEAFFQVGRVPASAKEMAEFTQFPDWKRDELTQLSLYREKLKEIMSNRRL